jgi:hypothetical protein
LDAEPVDVETVESELLPIEQEEDLQSKDATKVTKNLVKMLTDAASVSKENAKVEKKKAQLASKLLEDFGDISKFIKEYDDAINLARSRQDPKTMLALMKFKKELVFDLKQETDKILANFTQYITQFNTSLGKDAGDETETERQLSSLLTTVMKYAGNSTASKDAPGSQSKRSSRPGAKVKNPTERLSSFKKRNQ